ncbi:MAG: hypothetical protein L6R36_009001 [Xanthoria steineri]|nr:MAG: hypothetical protein L6R36_009001 [Xanthoria steineri]
MNHFIGNRQIFPSPTAPRGFVLYTPPAPNVRLPLIFWFCAPSHLTAGYSRTLIPHKDTCIVHVDAQHTPINPHHVWHLSQRDLEAQIEGIVDHCLIHGETGWPPQMGGMSTFDHDTFNGPLKIEVYGMPDYKEFDDRLDLGYIGLLSGVVEEAAAFQLWFERQRRQVRIPNILSRPQVGRNDTSA